MYMHADKLRLAHLKLEGFRLGAPVLFCPRCDFQYPFECAAVPICPQCDACLHTTAVTAELLNLNRAAA